MTDRDHRGRFRPGSTGNRNGRPPGTRNRNRIEGIVGDRLTAIIERLVAQAIEGDPQSAKLLLDRLAPSLRPVDSPLALPPAQTAPQTAQAVIAAMSAAQITPTEANTALTALRTASEIIEIADLRDRVEAIERRQP